MSKLATKEERKAYIDTLLDGMLRKGQDPLTAEERHGLLLELRDSSLYWAKVCVATGEPKGSGAAESLYKFADHEATKIENDRRAGGASPEANPFVPEGFDFSRILTNGMGDRIEA